VRKNGAKIVDEIAKDLEAMLSIRIDALKVRNGFFMHKF
jgi:hypothetical protein